MNVLKYLYFAVSHTLKPQCIQWETLLEPVAIKTYLAKVEGDGDGVEGIMTTIQRLSLILQYLSLNDDQCDKVVAMISHVKDKLRGWQTYFRKWRMVNQMRREEELAEKVKDTTSVQKLLANKTLKKRMGTL